MSVPDYETFMLPLLKVLADQQEHSRREVMDRLAVEFGLSNQDVGELLPSGQQTVFYGRVGWASTYLKKAELVTAPKRSHFKITKRGTEVLAQKPLAIDVKFLAQFPEFLDFRKRPGPLPPHQIPDGIPKKQTPEEALEYSYQEISTALASDLLEQVKNCPPAFFEKLVVHLLVAMGYGGSIRDAGQVIGHPGDGGIDGVIKQDPLGLDVVYIQAKRWQGAVGSPELQAFVGALAGQHASKGVFITTSNFTPAASDFVAKVPNKVILINGTTLTQLMIDHDIGVSMANTYKIKKIDVGYFADE